MPRPRHVAESAALDELLCFDLYAASRAMTRRYRPLLEELGLTYPQYLVIVVLGATGPAPIKDLVGALRLDHATLTPMLRRMEDAGLLQRERDPVDRRSYRLSLAERGWEAHEATERVQCTIREDFGLSADEVRDLQLVLRRASVAMEDAVARED
ncbi:MarR family transcriptional regulator [Nocardioides panacisoli]|uniref:MarR family winged helix-turn-helix transcriptional regulator n=1 Tax=Nocardioides panacisoli TaxID=627624 RepID=UPI001C62D10B|nr:MarR family transcriptional regulator [Nocardioides panacisoli]QYJ03365.1 MarR family transcriptional regulator [Nocardioides panacisoli]